jgi:hypothetical protein
MWFVFKPHVIVTVAPGLADTTPYHTSTLFDACVFTLPTKVHVTFVCEIELTVVLVAFLFAKQPSNTFPEVGVVIV